MCPRCGNECLFSRAEALEREQEEMKELSMRLSSISKTGDQAVLDEARNIISKLRNMNLRGNITGLTEFLKSRQKELFYSS